MKYSTYNSIIPLTHISAMLYNAVSDKFLVFRKELTPFLQQEPKEVLSINLDFYNQLQQGGFLIEDDVDEVEQMIKLGKERCTNSSEYNLIINPTMNCNFRCWYCYETHSPSAKMSKEIVLNVEKLLTHICKNNDIQKINLSFFGGEPLLYYNDTVRPIIDAIRANHLTNEFDYQIHFTTNGFLLNDRVLEHLDQKDDRMSFQITLDGHREEHNKVRFSTTGNGSYDRIVTNIKKLLEHQIEVLLRINYTANNAHSIIRIIDDIKNISKECRNYLRIDFQKVWQDGTINHDDTALNEALTAFKEEFSIVADRYNGVDSLRFPCYGDLINQCIINYNGDIYKCTARDFIPSNRLGQLSAEGEIKWNDPAFLDRRLLDKLNKRICKRCRIFPLCGGGCVQTASEADKNLCIKCTSELEKDKIILSRFYNRVVKHRQNESTVI